MHKRRLLLMGRMCQAFQTVHTTFTKRGKSEKKQTHFITARKMSLFIRDVLDNGIKSRMKIGNVNGNLLQNIEWYSALLLAINSIYLFRKLKIYTKFFQNKQTLKTEVSIFFLYSQKINYNFCQHSSPAIRTHIRKSDFIIRSDESVK